LQLICWEEARKDKARELVAVGVEKTEAREQADSKWKSLLRQLPDFDWARTGMSGESEDKKRATKELVVDTGREEEAIAIKI
jgi:hypothetical protein